MATAKTMYRPEGWENPYKPIAGKVYLDGFDETKMNTFEAGADAYEEGLKKEGVEVEDGVSCALGVGGIPGTFSWHGKGHLVFIPEE